ncbi:MAG TPA: hypothetical protein VG225_04635 [Terracidiphilus sp.]|jgi:hypothetical protein|nr:hypothetical protein [Terracidiphilus sp.]
MFSFRRIALLLALATFAMHFAFAQESSSSSNPPALQQELAQAQEPAQTQPAQAQSSEPQQPANANQGSMSVQARIRARREQRRAAAIRDVYSHRYEAGVGMGYLRFVPGPHQQRTTYYAWDAELTRYYSQRLGVTLAGRGYYGTAYVGLNQFGLTRPAISTYAALGGPTYRFYMQPKYSIAGRVMGGWAHGNFSGDTNGLGSTTLGLYPDGGTFAASAAIMGVYNISPGIGLRLAPEYFFTGFGSSLQASRGFTGGFVFRFGKQ